jgi:type I restriction enzyme S subunit
MKAIPGNYSMITLGENNSTHNNFQFDAKAVIVPLISSTGHGHASMKRVKYYDGKFALGSILCAVIPKDESVVNAKYLHIYLHENRDTLLVPLMKGTANVSLPINKLNSVEVIIPSLKRQLEIVELEKAISVKRSQLLSLFNDQNILIPHLRQLIIQEAIQGKLTAEWRKQNPNVEPASELLERIKAEKDMLVKEKKIKKEKPLTPILQSEIPFELPEGWEWCRLGDICSKTGSGSTPLGGKSVYLKEGIKFIRSQNVYNESLVLQDIAYISEATNKIMSNTIVLPNDLLLNITGGSIGRCCVVPSNFDEANISQHVAIIRLLQTLSNAYLHKVICSSYFQDIILKVQTGAGREGLPKNKMDLILCPIPPLAEQQVIIEKVEILLEKCNQLQTGIETQNEHSKNLLKALLNETFRD